MKKADEGALKIILYFLVQDGKLTWEKIHAFKVVGKYFSGSCGVYTRIIKECKVTLKNLKKNNVEESDYPELIKREIESNIPDDIDIDSYDFSYDGKPSNSQFKCLWCLMLLSYFYDISDDESIIPYIATRWNIHESFVYKMDNVARNIDIIEEYKNFDMPDVEYYTEFMNEAATLNEQFAAALKEGEEYFWEKPPSLFSILVTWIKSRPAFFKIQCIKNSFLRKTAKELRINWQGEYHVIASPKKLKIVFLFLLLTKKATKELYTQFDAIGYSFPGFERIRTAVIEDCLYSYKKTISKHDTKKRNAALKKEILSFANNEFSCYSEQTTQSQLKCIWLLTLVAFYFDNISEDTMEILEKLSKNWKLKNDVSAELIDTVKTFKALNDHKEWLFDINKSEKYPSKDFNAELYEIAKNWRELNQSISFLINEQEADDNDEDEYIDDDDDDDAYANAPVIDWLEDADNEADDEAENETDNEKEKAGTYDFGHFVKKNNLR